MSRVSFSIVALLATCGTALAGPFTPGNLVVVRLGNGSAAMNNQSQATFLDEYSLAGSLIQSIPMPTSSVGSDRRLTLSGTANSEGELAVSSDGRYLTLGGYDAAPGVASISSSALTVASRSIARIDLSGNVDTTTGITDALGGASIRGVATDDGSRYWATGGSNGVRFLSHGASTTTQITASPTNVRCVNIFNGQLFISSGSGAFVGVNTVGSGLPTAATTAALLTGQGGTGFSNYDFTFADANTLYVADDSAANNGLQKWVQNAGTWSLAYRITAGLPTQGQIRQFTVASDGAGNNIIFATSSNGTQNAPSSFSILTLIDTGAASSFSTIVTTANNSTAFRGIEFIGIPTPASASLIGLGLVVGARRRR